MFQGFTLSKIHFPTSSGTAIHSSIWRPFFTTSSLPGFINPPSVRDAGSLLVTCSYVFLTSHNPPPNITLPPAQYHTHSGVISHFDAISYFAHITPPSCAKFNAFAPYFAIIQPHSFNNFSLFGHRKVLAISVQTHHIFDAVLLGSYAPYFWINSFPVCHAFENASHHCFCCSLSCQYVSSTKGARTAADNTDHGVYAPRFEKNDAVSHATFGISATTHQTVFVSGSNSCHLYIFSTCFGCSVSCCTCNSSIPSICIPLSRRVLIISSGLLQSISDNARIWSTVILLSERNLFTFHNLSFLLIGCITGSTKPVFTVSCIH